MLKKALLLCITVVCLYGCTSKKDKKQVSERDASGTDTKNIEDKFVGLHTHIPEWLKTYNVPSVSVTVIENGKIVWSAVHGKQSPNRKANDKTLYLTASIAKPVTAEIFLRLASLGKVDLDEPMAKYWLDPDISGDPRALLLTPRHVLTHRTGFKNWRRMTDGVLRFERDPGTDMGYSGEGMQYLVRFIEKKLNRPFNDIAQELLFDPTGMTNSALARQEWYEGRLAWPLFPDGEWQEPRSREEALGAGGMHTTSDDYAKFMISVMNNEGVSSKLRREQFEISQNQIDDCLESATLPNACPSRLGFGLAWYVYEFEDGRIVSHSGANSGERTLAIFAPKSSSGLVVMTNGANGNHVIYKIAEEVGVHKDFIAIEKPKADN
ncbi:MAG: serine hydrolase domain-containing protein [Saonia sp.]